MTKLKTARNAMDSYNRYSISVRGASEKIADNFKTLRQVPSPSPIDQEAAVRHMRPLERLGAMSNWMSEITKGEMELGHEFELDDDSMFEDETPT